MGSLFGLLGIARDGMAAQTAGLSVTGQNVTNANTPGYVRRTALFQARAMGNGSEGGVEVTRFDRTYDQFAFARVVAEQGKFGSANARSALLAQLESVVAPGDGGIADRTSAMFASFQVLSASPSDPSARAEVLAKAGAFAESVKSTAAELGTMRTDLLEKATGVATDLNDKLSRIAKLNTQVAAASGRGESALDLRDERDRLVSAVSDGIGARAIEDKDGKVTVFAGGTVLVESGEAASLGVGLDGVGNLKFTANRAGGAAVDITASVNEGTLGGIREVRDTDLVKAQGALDSFAFDVANAINAAHTAGVGLDGNGGRPLFAVSGTQAGAAYSLTLDPNMAGHPERIAASSTAGNLPGGNDTALALAQLASTSIGGAPPSARFGALAAEVGTRKASADAELRLRTDTLGAAQNLNDSTAGVSVDEEMVNLTKFQRAFEASTKVLRTVDELLAGLMEAF